MMPQPPNQLPLWKTKPGFYSLPNVLLQCALFNARNRRDHRQYLRNETIYSWGKKTLKFTGEEWRQDEATVFMHVLHLARMYHLNEWVLFKPIDFLKAIGWPPTGENYKRLRRCLMRMAAALMVISKQEDGIAFSALSEFKWEGLRFYRVKITSLIVNLFQTSPLAWINCNQRKKLSDGLAPWLHSFYSTQSTPIPVPIDDLKRLAGLAAIQRCHFKECLRKALKKLQEIEFLKDFYFKDGMLHVIRILPRKKEQLAIEAAQH